MYNDDWEDLLVLMKNTFKGLIKLCSMLIKTTLVWSFALLPLLICAIIGFINGFFPLLFLIALILEIVWIFIMLFGDTHF